MYRPKKKEEPISTSNHVRLELLGAMPDLKLLKSQFEEASVKRGTIVELPWTVGSLSHRFMLMVQWMDGAEFPVWTLYEETGNESKMHWSQTFPPSDLTLVYDVMAMSASAPSDGGGSSSISAKIPDSLKLKYSEPEPEKPAAPPPAPEPPPPPPPPAAPPPPAPAPMMPPPPGYGYNDPYQQGAGGYPGMAAPPPGYPQAAPYGQPPAPGYGYPPGYPVNPNMPYPQAPPPPPQPPYNAPRSDSPWQPGYQPPAGGSGGGSSLPPELDIPSKGTVYSDLIQKKTSVLLGELLVEAGLVTNPSLQAALKIQDLVRDERMTNQQAAHALKKFHSMGAAIEDYLGAEDLKPGQTPGAKARAGAPPGERGATGGGKAPIDPEKARLMNAAIDLLQKSGILTDKDIQSASQVRSKHGGELPQILQAAGKVDAKTFQAAATCVPFIRDGSMKVEQCIILLNYSSRSRVGFDEAIEELGWPHPKK
ncbi:MAG TPA: hypothetical protein V6C72_01825 [Chroococcales cyanobacterium]